MRRARAAASTIGVRGILVHAVSDDAEALHIASGFEPSPLEPMALKVTLAALGSAA